MSIARQSTPSFRGKADTKKLAAVAARIVVLSLCGSAAWSGKDAGMTGRMGEVTMKVRPLTLVGQPAQVGRAA